MIETTTTFSTSGDGIWHQITGNADGYIFDVCNDHFDIYHYDDYVGIMHQLLAEDLGYE